MNNNIIEEHKNLENKIETEINNINLIQSKIKIFQKNIDDLKESIINSSDIKGPFSFLNQIFKNFVKIITAKMNHFNDIVLNPYDNLFDSYKFGTEKNLNSFKEIENDIEEAKNNLINKKEEYFNYIKESENEEKPLKTIFSRKNDDKKDENIFHNAIKENYNQLYEYELNKMDEIIEENNLKLNKIYKELNAITSSLRISIEDILLKFSKEIISFSEGFNTFSQEIEKELKNNKNKKEQPDKSVHRFTITSREMVKIEEGNNEKKEKEKMNTNSIKDKIKLFNLFARRKTNYNLLNKIDINNIEQQIDNIEKEQDKKNNEFIDSFVKKIISGKEIKSKEIIDLFNILKINEKDNQDIKNAKLFLNVLKKSYKHRIISFKNKNNFIHLSNIINSLCLKFKKNNIILALIIEVSQMIKYRNDYMYKIVHKKNEFLSTKTLWLKLIDDEFMEALNNFVDKKINEEQSKKNSNKEKDDIKNNILETLGLSKKITNYKKLTNSQKKELLKYGKEKICIII